MKGINKCAARLAFGQRRPNSHLAIYDELLDLHDEMMGCLEKSEEECELCAEERERDCKECEECMEFDENRRKSEDLGDFGGGAAILPPTDVW